ncbi:MAG: hypothetical protein U1E17_12640 [Geminicoccaceae bacterium]
MTDEELLALEGEERRRLLRLYAQTDSKAFLKAARCLRRARKETVIDTLLESAAQAREGRPPDRDEDALITMAIMMRKGEVVDPTGAAREVAALTPGHNAASTIARLVRKYSKTPPNNEFVTYLLDCGARQVAVIQEVEEIVGHRREVEASLSFRREMERWAERVRARRAKGDSSSDEQNS